MLGARRSIIFFQEEINVQKTFYSHLKTKIEKYYVSESSIFLTFYSQVKIIQDFGTRRHTDTHTNTHSHTHTHIQTDDCICILLIPLGRK